MRTSTSPGHPDGSVNRKRSFECHCSLVCCQCHKESPKLDAPLIIEVRKFAHDSTVRHYAGHSLQGVCPEDIAHKKQNQDSLIMMEHAETRSLLLGVLDGHGAFGDKISQFAKARLETLLFAHELFASDAKAAISAVLLQLEAELRAAEPRIGDYSGTTCALVLLRGNTLLVANVGDSRVVLARRKPVDKPHKHHHRHKPDKADRLSPDMVSELPSPVLVRRKSGPALTAHQLSTDHKPDQADEYARIVASGGRVFAVRYADGVVGPARVWLGSANMPGLAMSRSLGDFVVHEVGVLAAPEFTEIALDAARDCLLVLASDGLWDVLSNDEVAAMVASHESACRPDLAVAALLAESRRRWLAREQMADDTTICVLQLSRGSDLLPAKHE